MQRCWLANPEDRPKFTQALRELELIEKEEMVSDTPVQALVVVEVLKTKLCRN